MAKNKAKKKAKTFTTRDIADDLGIEPKTLRVWLRDNDMGVGRGKEYKFTARQVEKIIDLYNGDDDLDEDDEDDED